MVSGCLLVLFARCYLPGVIYPVLFDNVVAFSVLLVMWLLVGVGRIFAVFGRGILCGLCRNKAD
jgi:hypothetical protein